MGGSGSKQGGECRNERTNQDVAAREKTPLYEHGHNGDIEYHREGYTTASNVFYFHEELKRTRGLAEKGIGMIKNAVADSKSQFEGLISPDAMDAVILSCLEKWTDAFDVTEAAQGSTAKFETAIVNASAIAGAEDVLKQFDLIIDAGVHHEWPDHNLGFRGFVVTIDLSEAIDEPLHVHAIVAAVLFKIKEQRNGRFIFSIRMKGLLKKEANDQCALRQLYACVSAEQLMLDFNFHLPVMIANNEWSKYAQSKEIIDSVAK